MLLAFLVLAERRTASAYASQALAQAASQALKMKIFRKRKTKQCRDIWQDH